MSVKTLHLKVLLCSTDVELTAHWPTVAPCPVKVALRETTETETVLQLCATQEVHCRAASQYIMYSLSRFKTGFGQSEIAMNKHRIFLHFGH